MGWRDLTSRGTIRITVDFSSDIKNSTEREEPPPALNLYPEKLSFRSKEVKTFSEKQNGGNSLPADLPFMKC